MFGTQGNQNPQLLMSKYNEFCRMMQGKDPQSVLNDLLSSGKVSQAQVEEARRKASQFAQFLNIKM